MEDVRQMLPAALTQMVRLGLPGVHEPGLELELSDEDLALYDGWGEAKTKQKKSSLYFGFQGVKRHQRPLFFFQYLKQTPEF